MTYTQLTMKMRFPHYQGQTFGPTCPYSKQGLWLRENNRDGDMPLSLKTIGSAGYRDQWNKRFRCVQVNRDIQDKERLPFVWKTRKFLGEFKWNGSSRWKFSKKKVIPFFWNSDCLFIYLIYGVLSFLWKHDTFLAVYCTLLNNSYLGIYL